MDSLHRTIAANLKRIRLEKGLTQEQIAALINTSRVSIANIETGNQKATLRIVYDFTINVGCTVQDIFPPQTT